MQKISALRASVERYENVAKALEDIRALAELADEEDDREAIEECLSEMARLEDEVERLREDLREHLGEPTPLRVS